jgi:4-hydroxy 2-oxovalerate aldolase
MKSIEVLDCTLRDGGYVNEWAFGFDNAKSITELVSYSGAKFVEVGFIGPHQDVDGVVRFSSMEQLMQVFGNLKRNASLSVMTYAEGYSADCFPECSAETTEMIRVIFWKRNLKEGVEYCRKLVNKGYQVGVQLARTEQYDLSEIGDIVMMFNDVHPYSVYLVDSFGTFNRDKMLRYADIYEKSLASDIHFGFHAHNNMQQALINAVTFCEQGYEHDLILDASVLGIGRGAGNLSIELFMNYLNQRGGDFNLDPICKVANRYIEPIKKQIPESEIWGYSYPYFLAATTGRNHSIVNYLLEKKVDTEHMSRIFQRMEQDGVGIRFVKEEVDKYIVETSD